MRIRMLGIVLALLIADSLVEAQETRGGAPAYVGVELGQAFPGFNGRYLFFGLEGQEGSFDLFRIAELEGQTQIDYQVLFPGLKIIDSEIITGTQGSATARFQPPTLEGPMAYGQLDLLAATSPAMLLEPHSVDYVFISRDTLQDIAAGEQESRIAIELEAVEACLIALGLCELFKLPCTIPIRGPQGSPRETVRRFHSEVVQRSMAGRYFNSQYEQHWIAMTESMLSAPLFIYDVLVAQSRWLPAFRSALDGDGSHLISQSMQDSIGTVVNGYLTHGNPFTQTMIARESARMGLDNMAGLTIQQLIERVEASYTDELFISDYEVGL